MVHQAPCVDSRRCIEMAAGSVHPHRDQHQQQHRSKSGLVDEARAPHLQSEGSTLARRRLSRASTRHCPGMKGLLPPALHSRTSAGCRRSARCLLWQTPSSRRGPPALHAAPPARRLSQARILLHPSFPLDQAPSAPKAPTRWTQPRRCSRSNQARGSSHSPIARPEALVPRWACTDPALESLLSHPAYSKH